MIVDAVVSVTSGADVINDANVISVNLSYLVDPHNNSCQTGQKTTIDAQEIATEERSAGTGGGLRLGAGRGGVATLIRE
ncbi:hypothetical protein ARUE_c16060 [Arthrobacter sp. Rue61a]|nr:hypothetical protein ARUE_c16060 [Arthrobacter sp. Rue61a]